MDPKIWLIVRPHFLPTNDLKMVGICGTGFFIRKNIFITAYHVLNESSFLPNSQYFNNKIFLINSDGKKIEISARNIYKKSPEIDVVYIKTKEKSEFFKTEIKYSDKDAVTNIGYPTEQTAEILDKNLTIKKQYTQTGKISVIFEKYSMNANDVKIKNKKVIILNYSSKQGFSGGPLFKKKKVIGLMSHLYPQEKNAVAISMCEIEKILGEK